MLIRKTPTAERENYVYRFEDGSKVVIDGGDAMDKWIKMLHALDDAEVYNNIKNGKPSVENWEKESIERWKEEHPNDDMLKNWSLSMEGLMDSGNTDNTHYALLLSRNSTEEVDPMREQVLEKVLELTDSYQELYRLYFIEGYSQAEIAHMQNVNQRTVSKKIIRIQNRLKSMLRKNN